MIDLHFLIPYSICGTLKKVKAIPEVTAASIAFSELMKCGILKLKRGIISWPVCIIDAGIFTARIGKSNRLIEYEKNATMLFDKMMLVSKIPRTIGAFFLNDKIPLAMKEKTMKGSKKLRPSLKIRLIV